MTDMPWLESYPSGVRWDLDLPSEPLQTILDNAASKWPTNAALQFMGRQISYAELQSLANRAAVGLQRLGVGPGVHVGLYLPNSPHYAIAFFGVLKAGGTVVNYSPLDAAEVLEHKVEDSRTDLIITLDTGSLYLQIAGMLGKTRLKKLVVGSMAEMMANPEAAATRMQSEKQLVEIPRDDLHIRFADLIANDGAFKVHPIEDTADEIAVLQYTGGTTGLPKGAMLTHANLGAACAQAWETVGGDRPLLLEGQERILSVLPPFHIYALTVNLLFGVRAAAEIVQHFRFEVGTVLKDIVDLGISSFAGVPTMYTGLINHPDIEQFDLRSLKNCSSAGAPLPLEIAQRFEQLTGCPVNEGWGMTESSPTGTFTPAYGKRTAGSCGIPMPRIAIKFLSLDDDEHYVGLGQRGEMCLKGPNVMKGYWNNPKATAALMTSDGYMRTGDVGYMNGEGFVFIVDRTKDMLLCSGYNVYPRILEEAVQRHPAVLEVAVIGIDDAYRGQSPKAVVALKSGAGELSLGALQMFLMDKLGKHEMVQALEIVAALPKTAVGKISKKDLYDEEKRRQTA